jgi:hypothetical protein
MNSKSLLAVATIAAMIAATSHAQGMDQNPSANPPPPTSPAPGNPSVSTPIDQSTGQPDQNVSDTPPTRDPSVGTARSQPPLNQTNGQSPTQPPPSNAPVTTDQQGPTSH